MERLKKMDRIYREEEEKFQLFEAESREIINEKCKSVVSHAKSQLMVNLAVEEAGAEQPKDTLKKELEIIQQKGD